jgi:phosphatidylglycerophosphatase A
MNRSALWIASFFGVGHLPIAPGTWASFVTTLVVYIVHPKAALVLPLAALLTYLVGIPAASAAETHFARKDPGNCVIDEVAGQLVALSFLPHAIAWYTASFFLFRLFDIVKPFPVRQSEQLPRGLGIMTDDMLAGLYALLVLQAALRLWSRLA